MKRKQYAMALAFALIAAAVVGMAFTEVTGTNQQMLTSASTLNTASVVGAGFMPRCRETAIYAQWGAGVTTGTIVVESAHDQAYTGTWANMATVAWTSQLKEDIVQITGVHNAIRTRVSGALAGGTINTWITCN